MLAAAVLQVYMQLVCCLNIYPSLEIHQNLPIYSHIAYDRPATACLYITESGLSVLHFQDYFSHGSQDVIILPESP